MIPSAAPSTSNYIRNFTDGRAVEALSGKELQSGAPNPELVLLDGPVRSLGIYLIHIKSKRALALVDEKDFYIDW